MAEAGSVAEGCHTFGTGRCGKAIDASAVLTAAEDTLAEHDDRLSLGEDGKGVVLGVSTSYLRREFSRAFGVSPIAFLRDVRVANAKNMLESGVLSVGEIAEQCGFASPAYFIQVFHKAVGAPPDRYRRSYTDKK